MNDREKFLFDLNSYLVLEDVLTHAEVAAGNAAKLKVSPHAQCPVADPTPEEEALYAPPRRSGRTELRESES
jgi:hypothetical protein